MMKRVSALLLPILLFSSCVNVLRHDPQQAAAEAERFAAAAFVEQQPGAAYNMLLEEGKKEIPLARFTEAIQQMHPGGYPSNVSAIEFEPMPGKPAMNIFLHGKAGAQDFYYRFIMQGTAVDGYKVAGFFRSNGPPPASSSRQALKTTASDKGVPALPPSAAAFPMSTTATASG